MWTKQWPILATSHHQAVVIVLVQLIHFAATTTSRPITSWGIVDARYYSKGLLG